VRAASAGVHDALGDALVVEMADLLPQVEVLESDRAARAGLERVVGVRDPDTLRGVRQSPARARGPRPPSGTGKPRRSRRAGGPTRLCRPRTGPDPADRRRGRGGQRWRDVAGVGASAARSGGRGPHRRGRGTWRTTPRVPDHGEIDRLLQQRTRGGWEQAESGHSHRDERQAPSPPPRSVRRRKTSTTATSASSNSPMKA
jgi:hypothetical protein